MLNMVHSIPSVERTKSLRVPCPAEAVSLPVLRVALVTLKVAPKANLKRRTNCLKADCIPKSLARHLSHN
jgi:hypothetical protein